MPTYLRLIILLGEVIGFAIFSIVGCALSYREHKKGNVTKKWFKLDCIYLGIVNLILIGILLFSFPSCIFASYNKMIFVTAFIICMILISFSACILDKFEEIAAIIAAIGILGGIAVVTIVIVISVFPRAAIQFKSCVNEENYIEIIYPVMNLEDEDAIGYTKNKNGNIVYSYYYQDEESKWHFEEDFEAVRKVISKNEKPYIKKIITTKTFVNEEYKEDSEMYITSEENIYYVLFANEAHLIKIETD